MEPLKWAKKVKPALIRQLYERDASGALDEKLLQEIGFALWLRCRSIVFVSTGQIECPRCLAVFPGAADMDSLIPCPTPDCGWHISLTSYHASWRHQDLIGVNALPAFETFTEKWPKAETPQARMFLIDRLIHAFHWGLKEKAPNRSVGSNLLMGSHEEVVAFLDELTYGGTTEAKQIWREDVRNMWQKRRS